MTTVKSVIETSHAIPSFQSLSEAERQAALSFLLVSDHDAVLDGAWDIERTKVEQEQLANIDGLDSSTATLAITTDESKTGSSRSSTPSSSSKSQHSFPTSGPAPSTSACLLIRSKWEGWERSFELHEQWPTPQIQRQDEVLIEHNAIGLNPVDFKSVLYNFGIPEAPWVLGRDISGTVVQTGTSVSNVKAGDRVWTCADARDVRAGAYQSYSVARAVHVGKTPKSATISDEQAATLGTGLITAAIAAYWFFAWPRAHVLENGGQFMPRLQETEQQQQQQTRSSKSSSSSWVLIYGGGAITGIYLAQLARLAGLQTIAIASSSNFDYLTSSAVGVTRCIDRHLPEEEISRQVRGILDDHEQSNGCLASLDFVMDCVGSKTATQCHEIVSNLNTSNTTPAQMICLAGDPKNVPHPTTEEGPRKRSITIHRISFSTTFYGDDTFSQAVMWDLNSLLKQGQLRPVAYHLLPDGLAGVRGGLERLRDNLTRRACKLIVNVKDTPQADCTNLGVRKEREWNGVV